MNEGSHITPAELELEPVVRVSPDTTLATAARLMVGADVDTLFVDTIPATEITERDIVEALARGVQGIARVTEVAHDTPLFAHRDTPVERIVEAMLRARRHSVIVVDGNGLVLGLLTLSVVVAVLVEGPSWLGALRVALRIDGTPA